MYHHVQSALLCRLLRLFGRVGGQLLTISFLAGKVDALSLHTVLTIEGSDHRIAETIVENIKTKNQQILSMDSLQSVTSSDVQDGVRYLTVMEQNLTVLKQAIK